MSGDTPERLKAFRAQYSPASRRTSPLAIVQFLIVLAGFGAVIALLLRGPAPAAGIPQDAEGRAGLTPQQQRAFALYLEEKHQTGPALEAYEEYLETAALAAGERARIAYSAGKLAAEAELYEKALPFLYQAEFLDPDSDLKEEIGKKVVFCLEKLGRSVDLRKELRKRTDITRKAEDVGPDEVILAEFGDEVITDRDLDLEIEKLPPTLRENAAIGEQKTALLKNLVAERLLLDKARRLELDNDPEIQEQLTRQLDAMMVNKLIKDEVEKNIRVTPEDVERYYKAEIDLFTEPATAQVRVAEGASEEDLKDISEFPEEAKTMRSGGALPGVALPAEALAPVFEQEPGGVTAPIQGEEKWYAFQVVSKTPERVPPFEEVEDRAERMLRMQKEQEQVSAIIEETLKARNVQLHLEHLQGAGTNATESNS